MKLLPLFFAILEIINIFLYKRYYYYTQLMTALFKKPPQNKLRVVLINKFTMLFIANYILHFFFLAYCIYLMFSGNWQPGCMPCTYISFVRNPSGSRKSWCRSLSAKRTIFASIEGQ